jgi:hypothetical protein
MKNSFFYAVAACAMIFASCSQNDDIVTLPKAKVKDATLSITLVGQPVSRTVGEPGEEAFSHENKINSVIMAVFGEDGAMTTPTESHTFTEEKPLGLLRFEVASGEKQTLFVAANIPADYFDGLTTLEQFYGVKAKLTNILTERQFDSSKLPMIGVMTDLDIAEGGAQAVEVIVKRMVARVMLNPFEYATVATTSRPNAYFHPERIFVMNSPDEMFTDPTKVFQSERNTAKWTATGWHSGEVKTEENDDLSIKNDYDYMGNDFLEDESYYFYIPSFEPAKDAETDEEWEKKLVKLVIKGQYSADGDPDNEKTVYYMVVINNKNYGNVTFSKTAEGKIGDGNIYANTTYTINVVLKGEGADKPEDNVTPTMLDVTLNVAPWELRITQTVTFG